MDNGWPKLKLVEKWLIIISSTGHEPSRNYILEGFVSISMCKFDAPTNVMRMVSRFQCCLGIEFLECTIIDGWSAAYEISAVVTSTHAAFEVVALSS